MKSSILIKFLMSDSFSTALLISTYNWPKALELVLSSALKQSSLPNEIVIADDGSTNETKILITKFQKISPVPITHLWHEDIGFTKAVILNKAIEKIKSDYIIQIDGDIIIHKHFIRDHIRYAKKGLYLFGSRISLKEEYSKKVLLTKKIEFYWLNKGLQRKSRAIYFPYFNTFSKTSNQISSKLRGCNISYWKNDAININGYNEDFIGWGYEDSEFAQRLLNLGVSSFRLKHAAIQFHIYHKEAPKGNTEIGDSILIKTHDEKIIKCENGIKKTLPF